MAMKATLSLRRRRNYFPVVWLCIVALAHDIPLHADEKLAGIACRSVHWAYDAPAGVAFYNEVTIERSAPGTYFCVCGFNRGYFGLQELADGKRLAIFSVWDPGHQNDPNAVADDQRVKLLHQGEGVRVGRFGNEGTGGQSFFDVAWKTGATYRLLVTAKPATTLKPAGAWTEFAGFLFLPETGRWKHLVTFAARTDVKSLGGYYSFVEDFRRNRESTKSARVATFGNGWVRTTDAGWRPITRSRFTADANPATNINAVLRDGRFLLATGGDTKNDDLKLRDWAEVATDAQGRTPPHDLPGLQPETFDTPAPGAPAR